MFSNCKNVKVVYNLASFNESTIKYIFPSVIAVYKTIEKDVFKEYEGFVFIRIRDEYKLIDYIGNDVNIVLPTDFEGHNYTIYKKAFDDSEQIESIVITKGVIGFDDYALSSIANLKEVVFEDVIFTELSEYLLAYCKNLEKIELPSTVTVIPNRAFYECGSLKEVIIPDGVTTIGSGAFELCVNLENINAVNKICEILKIDKNDLYNVLENDSIIDGRNNLYKINSRYYLIDFAHTEEEVKAILQHLHIHKINRLLVVIGCGGDRDKLKRPKVGKYSSLYSDYVIYTKDENRSERTIDIIKDILKGVKSNNYKVILSRFNAIKEIINYSIEEDIIAIIGMGNDLYFVDELDQYVSDLEVIKLLNGGNINE